MAGLQLLFKYSPRHRIVWPDAAKTRDVLFPGFLALESFRPEHDQSRVAAYLVFSRFPFPPQDLVDIGTGRGFLHVRHEGRLCVRLRLRLLCLVIHFRDVRVEDGSVTLTGFGWILALVDRSASHGAWPLSFTNTRTSRLLEHTHCCWVVFGFLVACSYNE